MKTHPILVPGAVAEGEDLVVTAPFDGEAIAKVQTGGAEAVEMALTTAASTFADRENWLGAEERIAILGKIKMPHMGKPHRFPGRERNSG